MPPPPQNTVQESWEPEPELRDKPPRRITPADYPDLNQTNLTLFYAIGGVLLLVGLVLFFMGLTGKGIGFTLGGVVLALGGTAAFVVFPQKQRAHLARAENLVTNGIPVVARVLSSENLTGDSTYGRAVKYQVTLPGGEMAHRTTNADERALPKRVPGDTTALIDVASGDVELYCALPFRAVPKNPVAATTGPSDPFGSTIPMTAPTMASTVAPIMASTVPPVVPPAAAVTPSTGAGQFGDRLLSPGAAQSGAGQYGDRLPSPSTAVGGGAYGDRLPSPGAANTTPAPATVPAAPPTATSMGNLVVPTPAAATENADDDQIVPAPVVEKTPPAPKTPDAPPQTWE